VCAVEPAAVTPPEAALLRPLAEYERVVGGGVVVRVNHEDLLTALSRLKLTAVRDQLDSLLDEAAERELTLREALAFLVEREIARKDERRITMASKIAHFPAVRDLDGFDRACPRAAQRADPWAAQPSIDPRQIRELATCRWVAHGEARIADPPRMCAPRRFAGSREQRG
jgi:IstB-like ATP binding protein